MMPVPAGDNGHVFTLGEQLCRMCDAASLPSGQRRNADHASRRFGPEDRRCDVFEGEVKHLAAYEVQAGLGGWVIEGIGRRVCPRCGTNPLVRLRFSDDFRIVRDVPTVVDQRQKGT